MGLIADFSESIPSERDTTMARDSSRQVAKLLGRSSGDLTLRVSNDGSEETIAIPFSAFKLLASILNEMAQGNAVTLIPVHAELTTQQAADILNVSRPFVIGLIESKSLPCRKVGTHRRILFSDLMQYKKKIDSDRLKVLDELAQQAQELEMGY